MKTFIEWAHVNRLPLMEMAISTGRQGAKDVIGTGAGQAPGGGVGLVFNNMDNSPGGVTSEVQAGGVKNTNQRDEEGRMIWIVKTANSVYMAHMDDTTAARVVRMLVNPDPSKTLPMGMRAPNLGSGAAGK